MTSQRDMLAGVASAILAGALWVLVFLAPTLTPDFSAFEIFAGRYLAYGAVAGALIAPRWHGLRARLQPHLAQAEKESPPPGKTAKYRQSPEGIWRARPILSEPAHPP